MRIGIIGSGNIGGTLARLLGRNNHSIVFGVRDPFQMNETRRDPTVSVVPVGRAIEASEVVIVAIPFGAWPEFARKHGPALKGKVVLDTTNTNVERDGEIVDEVQRYGSGTLAFVGKLLPGTRLVKAFNTFESHALADGSEREPERLAHPLAGDDAAAVALAARLVRDTGFDAVIVGDAETALAFDTDTPVWNHPTTAADLAAKLGVSSNPAQVANAFFAAYADNDADAMSAICAPDAYIDYVPMGSEGFGSVIDFGVPLWRSYFGAFRDFRPEIEDLWTDERRRVAIVRTTNRGIHVGEVAGIEPAGRELAAPHLFQLALDADDRIAGVTAWWDNETIYAQLGQPKDK